MTGQNPPFVIAEGKRSFIAEQFRQLRTSLGIWEWMNLIKEFYLLQASQEKGKVLLLSTLVSVWHSWGKK